MTGDASYAEDFQLYADLRRYHTLKEVQAGPRLLCVLLMVTLREGSAGGAEKSDFTLGELDRHNPSQKIKAAVHVWGQHRFQPHPAASLPNP